MKKQTYNSPTKRKIKPRTFTQRFEAFIGGGKKNTTSSKQQMEQSLEDDAPSRPVVRFLIILLLLQIIVIGGIFLRSSITKSGLAAPNEKDSSPLALTNKKDNETSTPTPDKKTVPATNLSITDTLTQGVAPSKPADKKPLDLPQPIKSPETAPGSTADGTPALAAVDSLPIDEPIFNGKTPQLPAQLPAAGKGATPKTVARHLVLSGDTWETVSRDYACNINDLKKANPKAGQILANNSYLVIPSAETVGAEIVGEEENVASSGKSYTIKSGDTLSAIARKNKVPLANLMKINKFTDAEARKIKPGQVIKLP